MNIMNWREKDLLDLSLIELAYAHLSRTGSFELKHSHLESILPLTLNEINHVRSNLYSRNFVPIVGSFGVIEQIGFSYSRSDMPAYSNAKASPINKALYYFAGFSEDSDDMKVLYALRNSFLHSGSLLSKATHENKPSYYFQFNREMPELIKYPAKAWDGNIETFSVNQKTDINPEKVIDLNRKGTEDIFFNRMKKMKNITPIAPLFSEDESFMMYIPEFSESVSRGFVILLCNVTSKLTNCPTLDINSMVNK